MKTCIKIITVLLAGLVCLFTLSVTAVGSGKLLRGDANNDGKVDISDATEIQIISAKLSGIENNRIAAADVDGNGKIDIADATYVQMYLAEYENIYHIGESIETESSTSPSIWFTTGDNELPFIPN